MVDFIPCIFFILYMKCSHNQSNDIFTISSKHIMIYTTVRHYLTIFTTPHDHNSPIKTTDTLPTFAIFEHDHVLLYIPFRK